MTIQRAASLLGRTELEVMHLVANGELTAWTHSAAHGELLTHTNHRTGVVQQLPRIAPDTDPTSVRVDFDDVVWLWCVQDEMPRHYPDLPPKEAVEHRLQALNEQAKCAIAPLTQPPAPAQSHATPAPVVATKPGAAQRWTHEFTNEVRAYRASHTEAQTAEKYGVSGPRVRRKLAETTNASKPKATSFSGLLHRSK